jgi:hypothetical protein
MAQNMKLIEAKTVGAGGITAIDFTAIPQTYTDLKIVMSVRGDQAATYASSFISFNGSSTGFVNKFVYGEGANAASFGGNTNQIADQNGDTSTANTFSNAEIYIPNYTLSNSKSVSMDSVTENNATTAFAELGALVGPSAAITSITISPNSTKKWLEHSTFYLYGISNAAISPTPYATGGAIYQDDTYFYHMFTSTDTLTPTQALSNVDYLVVAGGAGGGYGGGGGAGGLRCTVDATGGGGSLPSKISLASGTAYTITIGAGGSGNNSYSNSFAGGNSSFIGGAISITSTGGGRGGGTSPTVGGSGGGYGNNTTGTGAAGTANEGFAGGNGDSPRGGGGGGGAGAVGVSGNGAAAPSGFGGNGGSGVLTTIGGNATYYAGGGGGAHNGNANVSQGQGGAGGGGTGGTFGGVGKGGTDGVASTGGGGGASNMNSNIGGNGGSGIVIVRYAK